MPCTYNSGHALCIYLILHLRCWINANTLCQPSGFPGNWLASGPQPWHSMLSVWHIIYALHAVQPGSMLLVEDTRTLISATAHALGGCMWWAKLYRHTDEDCTMGLPEVCGTVASMRRAGGIPYRSRAIALSVGLAHAHPNFKDAL